jgi:tripartite ATP-independent transporter DctP family solute receptor
MTRGHRSHLSRRTFAKAVAAIPLATLIPRRASAAEFDYKLATGQDPTHPNNLRMQEALNRIREKSAGKLDIKLFPANQLGSDTDLLGQLRNGGIDFQLLSTSILAVFVPVAGILNTAYAFTDYNVVWNALDGGLGRYVQSEIEKSRLVSGFRIWDNGFRQITSGTRDIRTPEDLKGFKIRVPLAPMLTSFFSAMGAAPAPLNFNEVYTSLQTKVIEGQENPLAIIATAKLYEVQKFCSMSGHSWDGYWPLANRRSWDALPADLRQLVVAEFDKSCADQRADVAALNTSLRAVLMKNGMDLHEVDREAFRAGLAKTSYYRDWKAKYGEEAWGRLEESSGKLAI